MIDPDDGLVIAEDVGEWSLEKHERLRKYVDITRETRRKYADGARFPEYHGGATYIDLFCGPGRARIRESGHIVDGSPLVAFKSAVAGGVPFSEIHLADLSQEFNDAAVQRIANAGGTAFGYVRARRSYGTRGCIPSKSARAAFRFSRSIQSCGPIFRRHTHACSAQTY